MRTLAGSILALVLLACGGGGGSTPPVVHDTVRLYVMNTQPAPHVVERVGWWRFADFQPHETYNWTDWTGDPLLPGETRFWIELPYEQYGYNISYETDQGGGQYIGQILEGDIVLTPD